MPTKKKSPLRPQPAQAAKKAAAKPAAVKKAPAKTAVGKAKPAAKQAPAKKPAVNKPAVKKAVVKKAATKKPGVKKAPAKPAPAKKPAAKPAAPAKPGAAPRPAPPVSASTMSKSTSRPAQGKTAKAPQPKASTKSAAPPAPPTPAPKPKAAPAKAGKAGARALLRKSILGRQKTHRPASFSLDEAREIAQTVTTSGAAGGTDKKAKSSAKLAALEPVKPTKPNHVQAASLADILGFSPGKSRHPDEEVKVPEKFKRYYKLLLELRDHLTGQIDQHSEETLKRSAKDDAGDLSSYGQHMADAGTDTFDRDFALSLVSSEQEALSEVEAAIRRIKNGSYGVCEVTGQPIAKERLLAVPFTRYSAEAQKEIERHRHRVRTQAGLFGEMGEDAPKISDGGDDE
jgi:RNA polymerase-binding transcription factor DksA